VGSSKLISYQIGFWFTIPVSDYFYWQNRYFSRQRSETI